MYFGVDSIHNSVDKRAGSRGIKVQEPQCQMHTYSPAAAVEAPDLPSQPV
jgi:hypothetical protein